MAVTTPKKPKNSVLARRCKYCRATFIPERMAGKEAKFCCAEHRKQFWRYGGLPFDKMKIQLWNAMKRDIPALVSAAVAAELEKRGLKGAA